MKRQMMQTGIHRGRSAMFAALAVVFAGLGASAADWRVSRGADGVPQVFMDGDRVEPWFFSFARMTEGNALEIDSVTNEIRMAKAAGTRIYSVSMLPLWGTAAEREKAERHADRLMARILAADPEAYVMPRVQMSEAPWLMRELTDRNLSSDGSREQPSVSSAHYRAECREALRTFIRRMEAKFGPHMAGYQVAGAHHGEFQYSNFGRRGNYLGYDEGTRAAFKAKTGLAVPSAERRSGERGELYYDPARFADVVRFNRFLNDEMADFVLELGRVVREECGRTRLVGAFYGYLFECCWQPQGPASSGHFALSKVLGSDDVDFLCGPYSYWLSGRCDGRPVCTHTAGESVTAHGKIWVNEDDIATHISNRRNEPEDASFRSDRSRDLAETLRLVRRNFAFSLARNYGTWWFDHHSHGMWNDPALWEERARFERLAAAVGPGAYAPDVYLTFQERMTDYFAGSYMTQRAREDGLASMRTPVARCGCVTGTRLVEDILVEEGRDGEGAVATLGVKLEIHPNAVAFTANERKRLRKRAEKVATVWMGTPGLVDLDGKALSLKAVEELTGFKVRYSEAKSWTAFTRPDGIDLCLPDKWGHGEVIGKALSPVLEPGDKLIATYRDAWGDPAVVLRPARDGRAMSVFCGLVDLPPEAIRALARLAGADVRVSRTAGVDLRGGFASITVAEAGPYDLKVNGEKTWYDAVSGESVGRGPVLNLTLQGQDTRVFVDETVWSRYRKEAAK